jgi:RNA polymerase sigma factor (sigma-70 family)
MEAGRVLGKLRLRREGPRAGAGSLGLAAAYDAYAGPVYRYLLTLLSDAEEADDALQEVFLGVMRRAGRGRIENVRAYLFQAARRQAVQAHRRETKRGKEAAAAATSWIDVDGSAPGDREAAIDIDRAVGRLPVEQREVLMLRLSEEMSFREIAEVLGIGLATAASRYRLGVAKVRQLLEEGEDRD